MLILHFFILQYNIITTYTYLIYLKIFVDVFRLIIIFSNMSLFSFEFLCEYIYFWRKFEQNLYDFDLSLIIDFRAYVEKYLLEKSRLVYQEHNERYVTWYYVFIPKMMSLLLFKPLVSVNIIHTVCYSLSQELSCVLLPAGRSEWRRKKSVSSPQTRGVSLPEPGTAAQTRPETDVLSNMTLYYSLSVSC